MSAADRLRGGRAAAARGHLSLDREKAREKLRMFRLPDPHFYVLQFVRAASVLGAKRVEFEISASRMTCRFDKDLAPELLEDFWGVAFEGRADADAQAVHYLALGLGSAQALNPAQIDIHTADRTAYIYEDSEKVVDRRKNTGTGTVIFVKEKFRFGHIVEFFQSFGSQLAETRALELHCTMSPMEVRVNGRSNRQLGGANLTHTRRFETEHERGFVALEALSLDGWCRIFKDGVLLEKIALPNHGRAAVAVFESSRVQTDLSGLALVREAGWDAPLHDVVFPHYHAALVEFSKSHGIEIVAERLDILSEVGEYISNRGGSTHPDTRALITHLSRQPLFQSALEIGGRLISIDDATATFVIRYSTERFPNVKLEESDVLLAEPYAEAGPHDARMRLLRESVISSLSKSGVHRPVNYTVELQRRSMAKRNRALWQNRPPHELGQHHYRREARVGPRRGFVFLPLDAPGEPVQQVAQGYFAFRESKLLRHEGCELALGTEFDGSLGVNSGFSDIIRDQGFGKLAAMLCGQTLGLHQDLARDLIRDGVDEHRRPRILDEFVLALHRGDWCQRFMRTVGYSLEPQITELISEHTGLLANVLWFGQSRPRHEFIERLGPIAQVPSIELANGARCSLADALQNDDLCLLKPAGNWRAFLAKTRHDLKAEMLGNIALADDAQRQLLLGLRAIPDARMVVERLRARAKYFARGPFVFAMPKNVAAHETKSSNWFEATLMLIPGGEQGLCITTFVWQGRVLGHRRFEVPMGSFEAVVRSDEFEPTAYFDNLQNTPRVNEVHQYLIARSAVLLDQWWTQRRTDNDPGKGADFDLFVDIAWALAPRHEDLDLLPVLFRESEKWIPRLVSRQTLGRAVSRSGLVLSYTRSVQADEGLLADPSAPVVRLGTRQQPDMLHDVLGHKMRFVDATTVGAATRVPPKDFWDKPARPMRLDDASAVWAGTIHGMACHCGLYHDPGTAQRLDRRIDMLTATSAELQELHGIGPNIASAIILFRASGNLTKPEDLLAVPGIGPSVFDGIKTSITVGSQKRESRTSNLVDVLIQKRKLESLDIETPMGKFRTQISGDAIVPDPTYKFAVRGRDKILRAAHEAAANAIRTACNDAREAGVPAAAIVPDLRQFLLTCRSTEQRPPFDLAELLESTPLFQTLSRHWLAFNWLKEIAHDEVVYWSATGDRGDVLWLTDDEFPLVEALLEGHLKLAHTERAWAKEVAPEREAHIEGDPILDTVVDLLMEARADRTDLFDDELARGVQWADLDRVLCHVTADKVSINPDHPLVRAVKRQQDIGASLFLASSVYSAINAYYREITDHDELELQSRLVRSAHE